MPANLTPQYHAAEARYRAAKTTEEKIICLEEMLAVIPKHKGTDHLQGDLKSRLAKLRQEKGKKAGARRVNPHVVEREGAAQVILIGVPNSGKSALLRALTHAQPEVAPYPFTTQHQLAGMMPFEDIQIQLVDTPPLSLQYAPSWIIELIKYSDSAVLVIDMSVPDPREQVEEVQLVCEENRLKLCGREPETYNPGDPFFRKCIIVGNKIDLLPAIPDQKLVNETFQSEFPIVFVSSETKQGLEVFKQTLFTFLEIVRVYSKAPHEKIERTAPFIYKSGSSILEVAESIHKDLAENFKFARVWGTGKFDGQRVPREYRVEDGDIVEIHA